MPHGVQFTCSPGTESTDKDGFHQQVTINIMKANIKGKMMQEEVQVRQSTIQQVRCL